MKEIESGDTIITDGSYRLSGVSSARESWFKLVGTWDGASIAVTDNEGLAVGTYTEDGGEIGAFGSGIEFVVTGAGGSTAVVVTANDLDL